jgi:hypothetical protein
VDVLFDGAVSRCRLPGDHGGISLARWSADGGAGSRSLPPPNHPDVSLEACQELGATAHSLGVQGISSPSATGVGDVLAVFVQRIGLGRIEPRLVEEWRSSDDLPS